MATTLFLVTRPGESIELVQTSQAFTTKRDAMAEARIRRANGYDSDLWEVTLYDMPLKHQMCALFNRHLTVYKSATLFLSMKGTVAGKKALEKAALLKAHKQQQLQTKTQAGLMKPQQLPQAVKAVLGIGENPHPTSSKGISLGSMRGTR
jgi:hypothetical protein